MKRVIVLITALAVMLTMVAGPVLAAPHKKPQPPKKHHNVCLQWTKIVKWSDKKFQKENKFYWVKAKKAYAYQAVKKSDWAPVIKDLGLDPERHFWKFKVVKLKKADCKAKSKKEKKLPPLPKKPPVPPTPPEPGPVCAVLYPASETNTYNIQFFARGLPSGPPPPGVVARIAISPELELAIERELGEEFDLTTRVGCKSIPEPPQDEPVQAILDARPAPS